MKTFKKFLEQMDNTQGWKQVSKLATEIHKDLAIKRENYRKLVGQNAFYGVSYNLTQIEDRIEEIIDASNLLCGKASFNYTPDAPDDLDDDEELDNRTNVVFNNIAHGSLPRTSSLIVRLGEVIEFLRKTPPPWLDDVQLQTQSQQDGQQYRRLQSRRSQTDPTASVSIPKSKTLIEKLESLHDLMGELIYQQDSWKV